MHSFARCTSWGAALLSNFLDLAFHTGSHNGTPLRENSLARSLDRRSRRSLEAGVTQIRNTFSFL